ncbi:CCHamide-1 receptor [Amblyomma americanum]|uniref:G-protein coupled receptors family 1 profile domain-containing protein n=1 Tax=Amblyomma americanum TaxID=6943 RepID=A0AAQ4EF47_AMBAM
MAAILESYNMLYTSTLKPLVANVTAATLRVTREQSLSRSYNDTPTSHVNLTTGHGDSEEFVPYEQRLETYVVPTVFAFIFLVGLLGNGTLILVFIRNRTMRSVPNIYIMSLSIGDFIVIAGTVPFISTIYILDSWPYGLFLCKLSEFLRDVSISVTVLTLTVLSIDRYVAIAMPLLNHKGRRHTRRTVTIMLTVSVWMVAILMAVPGAHYSFVMKVQATPELQYSVCYPFPQEMWPWYPKLMVLMKFLMQYALPLIIIATFYCMMARQLIQTSRAQLTQPGYGGVAQLKQMKARVKVAKIALAFVVLFAVCFFPNHVFMMWYYFAPDAPSRYNSFWHVWKIMGYVMTFVNSCLNPIALYLVSGVFRNHFKHYLFCARRQGVHSRNNSYSFRTMHSSSMSRCTASTRI